jgi:hypothetical protein
MFYIIKQIQLFFEIAVSLNTMSHIVKQMPRLKTVKAIPMEWTRLLADENTVNAYYERLNMFLPRIPPVFIVNTDESGFGDCTGAHAETFVVPADYPLDDIYIPTDRHIKKSTLIAVIIADGTGLKPLMIILRSTIEWELYFRGI